jgi:hypothetical protein
MCARPSLPPGEVRPNFNVKLDRDVITRLKTICYRRSVKDKKKFSASKFITEKVLETRLPATPTPQEIAAYEARHEPDSEG